MAGLGGAKPEMVARAPRTSRLPDEVSGRYEFQNNNMLTLFVQDGVLFTDVNGLRDEDWIPTADGRLVSTDRAVSFRPCVTPAARSPVWPGHHRMARHVRSRASVRCSQFRRDATRIRTSRSASIQRVCIWQLVVRR